MWSTAHSFRRSLLVYDAVQKVHCVDSGNEWVATSGKALQVGPQLLCVYESKRLPVSNGHKEEVFSVGFISLNSLPHRMEQRGSLTRYWRVVDAGSYWKVD